MKRESRSAGNSKQKYEIMGGCFLLLLCSALILMLTGITGPGASAEPVENSLILPQSLAVIGDEAFYNNAALNEVVFPDGIESIGARAFANTSLHGVSFPDNLKSIGDEAFLNDALITEVVLPESLEMIGARAFAGTSVTSVILPDGLTRIAGNAFGVGNGVQVYTNAGSQAHQACIEGGIAHIAIGTLPNGIIYEEGEDGITITGYTGSEAVLRIPGMIEDLPVTRIQTGAFSGKGIQEIILSSPLKIIENGAFSNCGSLKKVFLPGDLETLEAGAFSGCTAITEFAVPIDSDYKAAFPSSRNLQKIHYLAGKTGIMRDCSYDNGNADSYMNSFEFSVRESLTSVSFEEGVKHIGSYVFHPYNQRANWDREKYITYLSEIYLPSTLLSIGERSFYHCTGLQGEIVFPDGLTEIGNYAFQECQNLSGIVLPETALTLGEGAFSGCTNLAKMNLPAELTVIPQKLFSGCQGIPEVAITNKIQSLGDDAFAGCTGLTKITIPVDSNYNCAFGSVPNLREIRYLTGQTGVMQDYTYDKDNPDSYMNSLEFRARESLTTISFEEGIKHIGSYAFHPYNQRANWDRERYVTCLSEIHLPSSLQSVGERSFYHCTVLQEINLPDGLCSIGEYAFADCNHLQGIILPETALSLGAGAFSGCTSLSYMNLPVALAVIPENLFNGCQGIAEVVITNSISSLGDGAFAGCTGLTKVTIPVDSNYNRAFGSVPNLREIRYLTGQTGIMQDYTYNRDNADSYMNSLEFNARGSLTTISFEEGVTHIGAYAFYPYNQGAQWDRDRYVTHLSDIYLPSTLRSIGERSFCHCICLDEINLPDELSSIGTYAFSECTSLQRIVLPETALSLGAGAFAGCTVLTRMNLPEELTEIPQNLFQGCTGITAVVLTNKITSLGDGAFSGCTGLTKITVPIDSNYNKAFSGCTNIQQIRYLAGQTGIMQDCTYDKGNADSYMNSLEFKARGSLRSVTFEEGVVHIGAYAFCPYYQGANWDSERYVTYLRSVRLPNSLRSIGANAFMYCHALKRIVLPEGLETIGAYAFYQSGVQKAYVPNTVTQVGENAFPRGIALIAPEGSFITSLSELFGFSLVLDNPYVNTETYSPLNALQVDTQNTVLAWMRAIEAPDAWPSTYAVGDGPSWEERVLDAVVQTVLAQDPSGVIFGSVDRQQYLFSSVLSYMKDDPQVPLLQTTENWIKSMEENILGKENLKIAKEVLTRWNEFRATNSELYFDIILKYDKNKAVDNLVSGNNRYRELFDDYLNGQITRETVRTYLKSFGIEDRKTQNGILIDFDSMKDLETFNNLYKKANDHISPFADKVNKAIDAYNEFHILGSIDAEIMLSVAQVFEESEDEVLRGVGISLREFAMASDLERMVMIRMGKFADMKLKEFAGNMIASVTGDMVATEFTLMVKFSAGIVNKLTGVDKLPSCKNELQWSSAAATSLYASFQQALTDYDQTSSDENFSRSFWAYYSYCQMAAISMDELVELYQCVYDTPCGLFLRDENTEDIADQITKRAKYCRQMSDKARQLYIVWETGDVMAFVDAAEE